MSLTFIPFFSYNINNSHGKMEPSRLTQRATLLVAALLAVGLIATATVVALSRTLSAPPAPGSQVDAEQSLSTGLMATATGDAVEAVASDSQRQLRGTVETIADGSVTIALASGADHRLQATIGPETEVASLDTSTPPLPGQTDRPAPTPIDWTTIQTGDTIVISTTDTATTDGQPVIAQQILLLL
jgi:hypothetical protein